MTSATFILIAGLGVPMLANSLTAPDIKLIDDLSRRSFVYFADQTNPVTGLTLDRAHRDGQEKPKGIASSGATGFALTALCIAQDHHWITRENAGQRAQRTLSFLLHNAPREHGWFYHFMDAETGTRTPRSEVSSIDTAILLAGVLTARACFSDNPRIVSLATEIFNDVDFPWMMNGDGSFFSNGWMPESGFLQARWNAYSELLILYILGIGSPTHPVAGNSWDRWKIEMESECGHTFIHGGPLFIHQYPLAWIDLRERYPREPMEPSPDTLFTLAEPAQAFHANYFLNAIIATRAQRECFRDKLSRKFPTYSENIWGLTASDSPIGYIDWGDSLNDHRIDGSVAPSAVAGSLMFTPEICLPALRTMIDLYGKTAYGRYGFADAFNPATGWVSRDVVGIAVGITLLSAENLRTGSVWRWFMSNPEPERALDIVGLLNIRHPLEHYKVAPEVLLNDWNR